MKADFDIAANSYDSSFTNTLIGRIQRERVWKYLINSFPKNQKLNILELNCGTGEDAIFFAKEGHDILATDISKEMLFVAEEKAKRKKINQEIKFAQLDFRKIEEHNFNQKFDLIFSNFGGLNCLSSEELERFSNNVKILLKNKGRFIAVVMPDVCMMESFYFFAKLQWQKMLRRKTKKALLVNVDGNNIKTWYFSPVYFQTFFQKEFSKIHLQSIGFLPSYMESLINKFPILLKLDRRLCQSKNFRSMSDHYLIDFVLKE